MEEKGLCSICGKPLAPGSKSLCPKHKEINRRANFRRQREKAGIPLDYPLYKRFNKKKVDKFQV